MSLITIDEYRAAEKFFQDKMSGHWSRPLAEVAMVASVRFLLLIGKPERDVRRMFERTIAWCDGRRLDMPGQQGATAIIGDLVDKDKK